MEKILNKIKKLELLREQEMDEIKRETKRKLNMLDDERSNIIEKLEVNITTLKLRCIFYEKLHDFGKERKLKLSAKEKLNEIKRLKEEFKNNKHELLDCLLDG